MFMYSGSLVCVHTWRHVFRLQADLFVMAVHARQPGGGSQRRFPTDGRVCVHVVLEELFLQSHTHTHTHTQTQRVKTYLVKATEDYNRELDKLSFFLIKHCR